MAQALKCCSSAGSLELLALAIQVALQIERPDVAKKMLDLMQQKDDDETRAMKASADAMARSISSIGRPHRS